MPVRIPRFRPLNGDVVEINDLNEVFQEIAGDITSGLNEHSFLRAGFVPYGPQPQAAAQWERSSIMRTHQVTGTAGSPFISDENAAGQVVLELQVDTVGAMLHCTASFQADFQNNGARFWIAVNGATCTEATIGDIDVNGRIRVGSRPSLTGFAPFSLDTVQAVPPGTVTVQLLLQSTGGSVTIRNRELFVLEMIA